MTAEARPTQAPSLPVAILLVILPFLGVLQYRGLAPAVAIGLAAAVAMHRLVRGTWPWPNLSGPLLPALAIGAFTTASAAWSINPLFGLATGLKFVGFVLLGAAAAQVVAEDPAAPRLIRRGFVIGAGLLVALAFSDMLTGNRLRAAVRPSALRDHFVLIGGLKPAVTLIGVLLPMIAAERATRWYWRLAIVVVGVAAALLIPAETARISVVVGLLAWAAARFLGPAIGTLAGAAVAVVIVAAPLLFSYALPRLPSLEGRTMSAVHRVLIWDFTLQNILQRPALGWGAEAARAMPGGTDMFPPDTVRRFGMTSQASFDWFAVPSRPQLPLHPHNAALQIWLELGAFGALLGGWLAFALGRAAGRMGPGATGAFAAGTVTAMLSYGVWQEWWIGTVLLLACVAVAQRATPR